MTPAHPPFTATKAEPLVAFWLAGRLGSISAAAAALGVSQPAVSRQLARLQAVADLPLYQRTSRGIRLTPTGRELLPYAGAVARSLEQAERHLRSEDSGGVTLRLGLSHHLVTQRTGSILAAAKRYSQQVGPLQVHLVEGYSEALLDQVRFRSLDAALLLSDSDAVPAPLQARRTGKDSICLLTLPDDPIARSSNAPLQVLQGETLVLPSSESQVYRLVLERLHQTGTRPGQVLEVSGPAAVRSAVLAGQGVGTTVRSFVAPEAEAGWLRCIELEGEGFAIGVNTVMQDPDTLGRATVDALDAVLTEPISTRREASP